MYIIIISDEQEIDPTHCKLVLMCDGEPLAKMNVSRSKPRRRRRVANHQQLLAPEDYLPPSVLRNHMRPVNDLLFANSSPDLTNSCLTITTVCKEIVC